VSAAQVGPAGAPPVADQVDRRQADLPPVARLATVTLALVAAGGVSLAATVNRRTSLTSASVLAAAAALVLVVNGILLARIAEFAWGTFLLVGGWALLAYVVIAAILEFVPVFDRARAHELVLFMALLVLFAVDVPLLLAFSVARSQPVGPPGGDPATAAPSTRPDLTRRNPVRAAQACAEAVLVLFTPAARDSCGDDLRHPGVQWPTVEPGGAPFGPQGATVAWEDARPESARGTSDLLRTGASVRGFFGLLTRRPHDGAPDRCRRERGDRSGAPCRTGHVGAQPRLDATTERVEQGRQPGHGLVPELRPELDLDRPGRSPLLLQVGEAAGSEDNCLRPPAVR
jgi:hypothetical protein